MSGFDENILEDDVIEQLENMGWNFTLAEDLDRESLYEPLLVNNFKLKLKELNEDIKDEEIERIITELKHKSSGTEGIKTILNYLKKGIPINSKKENLLKRVSLLDYDNLENNEYIASRQVYYRSTTDEIVTDVMLYINGIPIVNIELKNPFSLSKSWLDAYRDIKSYESWVPELYKYTQVGVAAEQKAKYFPIIPWQKDTRVYEWKSEIKDPVYSTLQMFLRGVLPDIIQNYLFLRQERGRDSKVIARYMQYRAADKIVDRVLNNLKGIEDKNKGLIWHWQGSGKTLTMIFAAVKLFHRKELENPTIFFIVDRTDLEDQLFEEFGYLDMDKAEKISSIKELKKVLMHDNWKGKRGLFISLINKFEPDDLSELYKELEKVSKQKETIQTRKNVIVFIDEAHRSQYGNRAALMKKILRSAFRFAFTGTPISKEGRDTYSEFSYPEDNEKYLDRYFITESIEDGFTVKIVYQPRLPKYHLKPDLLDAFLKSQFDEIDDEVEKKVKSKLNFVNLFLENPTRIKKVTEDIAEHFKENVDGNYKAMVVTPNKRMCVLYKKELDDHLPKEYSEVVMSYDKKKDPKSILEYRSELKKRFHNKDTDAIKKEIVANFKEEEFPKILIVTDMLLTGFDAPILQTMYLDKPLKEHKLLQAIARTNRPFNDIKEAGVIIDYIGTVKEYKRALENYTLDEIKGVLYDFDSIRNEFNDILDGIISIFKDIPRDKYDRVTLFKALDILTQNKNNSEKFIEDYVNLRKIFELLGPDEVKIDRFADYKWVSAIYIYYVKMVDSPIDEALVEKYVKKTIEYVHNSTEIGELRKNLPIIKFDKDYLKNLEKNFKNIDEKAANIVFTLKKYVLVEKNNDPVYESVAKKIEKLLKRWESKNRDLEKIYAEGLAIFEEMNVLNRRKNELNFSKIEYSLLLTLEDTFEKDEKLKDDVKNLLSILNQYIFPRWYKQISIWKKVEENVLLFTIKTYMSRHGINEEECEELTEKLMEKLKKYA